MENLLSKRVVVKKDLKEISVGSYITILNHDSKELSYGIIISVYSNFIEYTDGVTNKNFNINCILDRTHMAVTFNSFSGIFDGTKYEISSREIKDYVEEVDIFNTEYLKPEMFIEYIIKEGDKVSKLNRGMISECSNGRLTVNHIDARYHITLSEFKAGNIEIISIS